jgi:hypothetical protein
LISALETEEAPETYARGSKCIDFILVTPRVKQSILSSGYVPFYAGGWDSDHRALFIDINMKEIFGNYTPERKETQQQNLKSNNWVQATKYMRTLRKENGLQKIIK